MREAEEVAREAFHPPSDDPDRPDPAGPLSGAEWYEYALRHAERVIRARDAEVRAATLAEFTEETDTHHRATRVPCDCEHPMHARLLGDDSPPTHVTAVPVQVRRYVTPWEPDPRTPEQTSDDTIARLRARLTGEEP